VKRRNAAAHGALGILTLSSITDEGRYPFEKRVSRARNHAHDHSRSEAASRRTYSKS